MRVFVPVDDDWDGRLPATGEKPVPYRAGLPLWHLALSPANPSPDSRSTALPAPAQAIAA